MLLFAKSASRIVVDMQERLLPAMRDGADVERRCALLIRIARRLDVPVTLSEQYPKGLGHTVEALRAAVGNAPVFEKSSFSCWRDAALKRHLIAHHEQRRPQVILAGIEAHVCVLQTAIDLSQAGFAVFAVSDAVTSRSAGSVALALARLGQQNVQVVNTEMVLFELLETAGTAEFRELSALIR